MAYRPLLYESRKRCDSGPTGIRAKNFTGQPGVHRKTQVVRKCHNHPLVSRQMRQHTHSVTAATKTPRVCYLVQN